MATRTRTATKPDSHLGWWCRVYAARLVAWMTTTRSIRVADGSFFKRGFPAVERLIGVDPDDMPLRKLERHAHGLLRELIHSEPSGPDGTWIRVKELSALFQFGPAERAILRLAAVVDQDEDLYETLDGVQVRGRNAAGAALAALTDQPPAAVLRALSRNGVLCASGLLPGLPDFARGDLSELVGASPLLSQALGGHESPEEILSRSIVQSLPPPRLTLAAFDHLGDKLPVLRGVLAGALKEGARGVNVLIYGEPGTGKTELARALVKDLSAKGLRLRDEDDDGDVCAEFERLRQLPVMHRLAAGKPGALIVVDEADELLAEYGQWGWVGLAGRAPSASVKSWKTRLLEENPVPTIWIANWTHAIDPALLRRFVFVLEAPKIPRAKRIALLREGLDGELPAAVLDKLADVPDLTPADIERARRATELCGVTPEARAATFLTALAAGAQGARLHNLQGPARRRELPYRSQWLHAEPDLASVVRLLRRRASGRLCFFGPPGTGKTAFAKHLARELDVPLIEKKASDLLDCYVGQTEKHLAETFEEARRDRALLLIDEADSFLQDRAGARHSWEVTQVNELLKQIEEFDGHLVLCTNFMEHLDSAVLRRLDLKVRFDWLRPDDAREAFLAATAALGIPEAAAAQAFDRAALAGEPIAPGDLVAAINQAELRADQPDAALLADCLRAELEARERKNGRRIGFCR